MDNGPLIVAVSTPPGRGAIAIVRFSGEKAAETVCGMFEVKRENIADRTVRYGRLRADGIMDNAVFILFRGSASYTGEDSAEIHCHGSPVITAAVLNEAIRRGARVAAPGEFTRRAYLNGKLDLTAAEGIIDLIDSTSAAGARAAYELADGALYKRIGKVAEAITAAAADIAAAIDYPEEADTRDVDLAPILTELQTLANGYPAGAAAKEGVNVVIAGPVNAGKSALFNALLGRDRAIVTDVPGTTRDTVTDSYEYKGIRFHLTDTAGIRESEDAVERLGIERSRKALRCGDIILSVAENGTFTTEGTIRVGSKGDLSLHKDADITVSAKTGENIEALKEMIYTRVPQAGNGALLVNARQYEAVVRAAEHVGFAAEALTNFTPDCAASELDWALTELGAVTGVRATDAIIDDIFKRFCVGK